MIVGPGSSALAGKKPSTLEFCSRFRLLSFHRFVDIPSRWLFFINDARIVFWRIFPKKATDKAWNCLEMCMEASTMFQADWWHFLASFAVFPFCISFWRSNSWSKRSFKYAVSHLVSTEKVCQSSMSFLVLAEFANGFSKKLKRQSQNKTWKIFQILSLRCHKALVSINLPAISLSIGNRFHIFCINSSCDIMQTFKFGFPYCEWMKRRTQQM